MQKTYQTPSSSSNQDRKYIIDELSTLMGIDIFEPQSPSDKIMAHSFGEFSHFVLHTAKEECLEILEMELNNYCSCSSSSSVGVLQGGSDSHSIYRVSFPITASSLNGDDLDSGSKKNVRRKNNHNKINNNQNTNAALQLLQLYNQQCIHKSSMLSIDDIQHYMLDMVSRRHRRHLNLGHKQRGSFDEQPFRLGNVMFILQFGGPTLGQVRHIDNMVPNVQICLYMSQRCPSTIVYAVDDLDGLPVTDGETLLDFWERQHHQDKDDEQRRHPVPMLIKQILLDNGDRKLKDSWHTKYFSQWKTINSQLECFGKLYQPVSRALALDAVPPGATLIAGGNDIHAGPPTVESRLFAFAIGIISECDDKEDDCNDGAKDDDSMEGEKVNDGEVQYSPVLLHIDFCCLLFSILDHEYKTSDKKDLVRESKDFLVHILINLIRDSPTKQYLLQVDEDRVGVRKWLEEILNLLLENCDHHSINSLMEEAVDSDTILYSPDVVNRRSKRKNVRDKSKMKGNGMK